jgi:hypothetical protein
LFVPFLLYGDTPVHYNLHLSQYILPMIPVVTYLWFDIVWIGNWSYWTLIIHNYK